MLICNVGSPLFPVLVQEGKHKGNCLRQREPIHLLKGGVIMGVMDVCVTFATKRAFIVGLVFQTPPWDEKIPVWSLTVAFILLILCLPHHGFWLLIKWQPSIREGKSLSFLLHSRPLPLSLLLIPRRLQHTALHTYPLLLSLLSYTYHLLAPKPSLLVNKTTEVWQVFGAFSTKFGSLSLVFFYCSLEDSL